MNDQPANINGDEKILGRFDPFPGVGMTEAYLLAAFEDDRVLHEVREQMKQTTLDIATYEHNAEEARAQVQKLDFQMAEARAALKALESERRRVLGEVESWSWKVRHNQNKQKERESLIHRRQKTIYADEINRLVKIAGKEIRVNKGYRRTKGTSSSLASRDIL